MKLIDRKNLEAHSVVAVIAATGAQKTQTAVLQKIVRAKCPKLRKCHSEPEGRRIGSASFCSGEKMLLRRVDQR